MLDGSTGEGVRGQSIEGVWGWDGRVPEADPQVGEGGGVEAVVMSDGFLNCKQVKHNYVEGESDGDRGKQSRLYTHRQEA